MRDVIEIETERLVLRPLRLDDAARVSAFTCDPAVARMTGRIPLPHPRIAAEGWILILMARAPLGRDFVFGVELKREGLIGVIGAHRLDEERVEIGYWIGRPYWGEGFATEALRGFIAEAQSLGTLVAGHFVDNPASGRVLEKAGFVYTGDVEPCFSLARGEKLLSRRMRLDSPRPERRARAQMCAC